MDENGLKDIWVLGFDENQKDLSEWMQRQLTEHSDKQVVAIDLSMFENAGVEGWFLKPLVMREAFMRHRPDRMIWIDNDIEIRENIDDMFDMIEDDKFLIAKDWARPPQWNTGIVGLNKDYPQELFGKWLSSCLKKHRQGDQECLSALVEKYKYHDKIKDLPPEYHGQRLMLSQDDISVEDFKTMHWTGWIGKAYIRKSLI